MNTATVPEPRTAAALAARRRKTEAALERVHQAIARLRREDAALELVGRRAGGREDDPTYIERLMPTEYAALFTTAADNLRLGLPVVLDAPFAAYLADPDFLTAFADQASWPTGTPVVVVEVRTSAETVRTRLTQRGLPRDRAKLADWPAFWQQLGTQDCTWSGARHIVVDNDGEPDLDGVVGLAGNAERESVHAV